ncbi:MAG: redox-sensing transcriptional repressor Rex [Ruminococcus sp.]|nr:redox-sensing transcriptional repressor Rex [Ruminococcus sp.]
MAKQISMPVIRRLPRYHRFLTELEAQGVERISSNQLATIMRSTASQIRQDLNCFGGFGQQGYGYPVTQLKEEIGKILGINQSFKAILLGAGNLGKAVATHMNFSRQGFELTAVFDNNEKIIGSMLRGIKIMSDDEIENYVKDNQVDAAFLCLPRSAVKPMIDKLYSLGIKNYWNFSHYDIKNDYKDVIVENVHMSDSLMTLCYRINETYNNK